VSVKLTPRLSAVQRRIASLGYRQVDLAGAIGVTTVEISRLVRGERRGAALQIALARALRLQPDELWGEFLDPRLRGVKLDFSEGKGDAA
jgi:transcriptional regulator with XRE-family HTH domain